MLLLCQLGYPSDLCAALAFSELEHVCIFVELGASYDDKPLIRLIDDLPEHVARYLRCIITTSLVGLNRRLLALYRLMQLVTIHPLFLFL